MANTPSNDGSGHRANQSPSLADSATGHDVVVALTGSARIYAGKARLDHVLAGLKLPVECLAGDIISVSAGGESHDFTVLRRRWIIDSEGGRLEVTLDFPVRAR